MTIFSSDRPQSEAHLDYSTRAPSPSYQKLKTHSFIIIIIIIIIISDYNWIYAYLVWFVIQGYIAPSCNILRKCRLQGQTLLRQLPNYANRSVVRKGCSMAAFPRQKLRLSFGLPHLQQKFRFVTTDRYKHREIRPETFSGLGEERKRTSSGNCFRKLNRIPCISEAA